MCVFFLPKLLISENFCSCIITGGPFVRLTAEHASNGDAQVIVLGLLLQSHPAAAPCDQLESQFSATRLLSMTSMADLRDLSDSFAAPTSRRNVFSLSSCGPEFTAVRMMKLLRAYF